MDLESPGRRKLSKLVSNHVLSNIHRDELLSIVHRYRVAYHLRDYRRPAGPCFDDLPVHALIHDRDFPCEGSIYKWTFFYLASPLTYFLRFTINLSVALFFRVLYPLVGFPHGVQGCLPPEVFPSPPPRGWSTGFIATPRTWGLLPSHRDFPALPIETLIWSRFPTCPMVAIHFEWTILTSPDLIRRV